MSIGYRIADEPAPSNFSQLAVNPIWPLFSIMFAGAWFAWPWFVINSGALGSPTFRRELSIAIIGYFGAGVVLVLLSRLAATIVGPEDLKSAMQYIFLGVTVWKLAVSYWLYTLQARTIGIYEYYGGVVRSGFIGLLAGALAASYVLRAVASKTEFLWVILR